jgi:ABC-2 type transport system ATP-binding protein
VLAFVGVSKAFSSVQALTDCSFSVAPGRMLGFLGPNGAGKTTAMRSIFGVVAVDGGELLWNERRIEFEDRLRFGYMPEERGLYPRMAVGEQLEYLGALHGLTAGAARAAAVGWLERLGLADRAGAKVEELSHGNQQRVQLAAALLHEPELLVLDEPFAGLDPLAVQTLAEVLRGEAERGAAVLFSSHQLDLVQDICEEVAIIDHGHVVASGDMHELRRGSRRRDISLEVDGAPPEWQPGAGGAQIVDHKNGGWRLSLDRDADPEQVLADAKQVGRVVSFEYAPPSLAEVFLELVGA